MRFRKLRTAFSVTCLIACVLLIALWARSYSCVDTLSGFSPSTFVFGLGSERGTLGAEWQPNAASFLHITRWQPKSYAPGSKPITQFFCHHTARGTISISLPTWFTVFVLSLAAAAPWIGWSNRFSLRTLLIAMTLVAVVLGLIVAVLRWPAG
jgi:hypothetical protein